MRFEGLPYIALILMLGLTMLGTQIYGLATHPSQTVTSSLKSDSVYLILMSANLLLQCSAWALCLFKKARLDQEAVYWGFGALAVVVVSWIGLTSVLNGNTHNIFTGIFVSAFLVLILIMCYLVWQPLTSLVLRACLAAHLVCCIIMLILFNKEYFYLPEHIAFINYSVVFLAFFLSHPYDQWAVAPDSWEFEEEDALLIARNQGGSGR